MKELVEQVHQKILNATRRGSNAITFKLNGDPYTLNVVVKAVYSLGWDVDYTTEYESTKEIMMYNMIFYNSDAD